MTSETDLATSNHIASVKAIVSGLSSRENGGIFAPVQLTDHVLTCSQELYSKYPALPSSRMPKSALVHTAFLLLKYFPILMICLPFVPLQQLIPLVQWTHTSLPSITPKSKPQSSAAHVSMALVVVLETLKACRFPLW